MKEGWEYIDFKDFFPIKMGKTPPRGDKTSWDEKKETHNKWVSIADISNNEGKIIEDTKEYISDSAAEKINKVSKGSLLMSFKLSIGRMAFAGDDLYTNEAIIAIPENDKYILRFIYYYLLSYDWLSLTEGNEKVKGATLNKTSIGKIQLPVLSLIGQQAIVDYLDSAFAKIDAMKANAEKALNEAKALFQASLKEMLEPKEGWEEKTLLVLTSKIGSGATPKGGRKVYIDEGCHLIRSMNVQYNEFKYEDLAHITDEAAEQLKGVEIQENDVLFNITGASIARCCVVPTDALPARVNQHVSILRLKQDVLPRFLSYILNSPKHQRELLEIGEAGSTRQALTKTDLENHVICYPNIDSQIKLLYTLDSLKSKVDRLQESYNKISQECDALKQAILRQVFE